MSFDALLAQVNGPPTPTQAFNFLLANCSKKVNLHAYGGANEGYNSDLAPIQCENIGDLISALSTRIKLNQAIEDTLTILFAVAISLEVSGPFIWMHIAGPSSSLKTTILELIGAAHERVFSVTNFSSFYSGSTVGGRDNSLLPQIQGKLFIIKDLTPLLEASQDIQKQVFPQLRDIYDGNGSKFFNNGVNLDYKNVRFVCVTGVTYIIHKFSRTDMGERFLICDINSSWSPDGELIRMDTELLAEGNAFDSVFDTMSQGFESSDSPKLDNLEELRCMAWGLLNHLFEYMQDEGHGLKALGAAFKADRSFKLEIDSLAVWMEHARCKMPSKADRETIRPVPALPHRAIKQLSKVALTLAIVTKSAGPTSEIRRLVRKFAFDSAFSYGLEIMNLVATIPEISKAVLASRLSLSPTHISNICDHLTAIGVIERRIKPTGTVGQPNLCWILTPKFRAIADAIGLKEHQLHKTNAANPIESPSEALDRIFPSTRKSVFGRN
jgi:hypothetical protein